MSKLPKREISENAKNHSSEGTRLETVEDIRKVFHEQRNPTVLEHGSGPETLAALPNRRPPMAMLCILDDDHEDGEWVRIRADKTVIGRSEGDLLIPHDNMMSGRHAELCRQAMKNGYRWQLTDLQSTNGTFVRIAKTRMWHGQEFFLGSRSYRFDDASQASLQMSFVGESAIKATQCGWQGATPSDLIPSMVELTPRGEGQRFLLTNSHNAIGRDAKSCSIVRASSWRQPA